MNAALGPDGLRALDIGVGSERAGYVNQDSILHELCIRDLVPGTVGLRRRPLKAFYRKSRTQAYPSSSKRSVIRLPSSPHSAPGKWARARGRLSAGSPMDWEKCASHSLRTPASAASRPAWENSVWP